MKPAKVTPRVLDPERVEAIKAVVTALRTSGCEYCPLCIVWHDNSTSCGGTGDDVRAIHESDLQCGWPKVQTLLKPLWCPLRSGPVTVELEEGAI